MAFTSYCPLCEAHCALRISLSDGRVVDVSGNPSDPDTGGFVCPKGKALLELQNAPDRLRFPLVRAANGELVPVEWDRALEEIATRISIMCERYGPQSVAIHVGRAGVASHFIDYVHLFTYLLGSPNFSHAGSHCYMAKVIANSLTFGTHVMPHLAKSRCVVLWGHNPSASCPALVPRLRKALRAGTKLIVVDPVRTPLAREADLHLQLRPGTDGALALALLNVLIDEGLYDSEFVSRWVLGFDALAERCREYAPEKASKITWVPPDDIRKAAAIYAGYGPSVIAPGVAVELNTGGVQALRAIAALQALSGNVDIPGGAVLRPRSPLASLGIKRVAPKAVPAVGAKEFPLFASLTANAQANLYASAILEGIPYPVRGLLIHGSNPLLTWPGGPSQVLKAFKRLDLLVVMDHFLTPTARLAHVVLPAATCFEHDDLYDRFSFSGEPRLVYSRAVVESPKVLSDWEVFRRLASLLLPSGSFPWPDERSAIAFRLGPLGVGVDDLERLACDPGGISYSHPGWRTYERNGFRTPSGRVEILSERVAGVGQDPLPAHVEPGESPSATPELAREFPLVLSTGARHIAYVHSRGRNLPSLRRLLPEPVVEVHPAVAAARGLTAGRRARVVTPRGSVEATVWTTPNVHERVIRLLHGWEESNVNLLSDYGSPAYDAISGFPAWRALLARLEPAEA